MADPVSNATKKDEALWFGYDLNTERAEATDSNAVTRKPSNELDKDAFLKLLLVQMQNQDPLDPVDNKDMLAQMAQFTTLEQMQNMSKSFSHSQAFGMIGKSIYAEVVDEKTGLYNEILGNVDYVKMRSGEPYLMVEEKEVPLNKVQLVFSDSLANSIGSLSSNMATSQNLGLIGKYVQAITTNEKKEITGFVEGKVDYLKFDKNGVPVLIVNNQEIYGKEVISVSDNEMPLIGSTISAVVGAGDEKKQITGTVTKVEIKDNAPFLNVSGEKVYVKNIGLTCDALRYIGQNASYDSITGKVAGVIIRGGNPFLQVVNSEDQPVGEINFGAFKGLKMDEE